MKKPYNIYCFMLLLMGRKSYFYRCAAHSKDAAYKKMLTELMHDTNLLRSENLNTIRLLHTITDSDNDKRFIQGLHIAAQKYYNFVHNYEYAAIQQFYYLNTYCAHCQWSAMGNYCKAHHMGCKMDNGYYCRYYTKGRDYK